MLLFFKLAFIKFAVDQEIGKSVQSVSRFCDAQLQRRDVALALLAANPFHETRS
jgi:hypothetical protein